MDHRRREGYAAAAATALLAGLLLMWTVVTPAYRASDEPMHVSTAVRLAESGRYPEAGRALMDPAVLASYRWVNYFGASGRAPALERSPGLAQPPSMSQLEAPDVPRPRTAIDQMTQHPPGYYLVLAGAIRLLSLDGSSPTGLVLALRLVSVLMFLPIPFLCLLVARQVGLSPRVAAAAAFLPAAWTQFVHSAASVSNGALLALSTSVAIALVVPVARGDVRVRRALGVGAAVSVGLFSKGFALALLPVVVFAYLLGARRGGAGRALLGLVVAGVATLPGLWWWVLNVVRYGALQPQAGPSTPQAAALPPVSQWAEIFGLTFMRTLWIALGWAENRPPQWLYVGLTVCFALLLLVGSWALRRRVGVLLLLHLCWLGPLAIVVLGSFWEFERSGQTRAAQGRYVQTAIVAFAVLAAAALFRLHRVIVAVPPVVLAVGLGGIAFGLYHFWVPATGYDRALGRVVAMSDWWPGGGATWLVVGAGLAVIGGLAGVVTMRAIPQRPAPARDQAARSGEPVRVAS